MTKNLSLNALWKSVLVGERAFLRDQISHLPAAAQQYLMHAIDPGTLLATGVRLRMHGEVKLKRWLPFTAEQVIYWDRGMIWSATVRMNGLPILGSDRLVESQGSMQWKFLGLIPIMTASGPNITRSAIGRAHAESVWLPSVFCTDQVSWTTDPDEDPDKKKLHASFTAYDHKAELDLKISDKGQLKMIKLQRWGNPEGAEFHYADFGAIVEAEHTFYGYTIPSRLRIGWYLDTERFESEGEFFRVTIDEARYR